MQIRIKWSSQYSKTNFNKIRITVLKITKRIIYYTIAIIVLFMLYIANDNEHSVKNSVYLYNGTIITMDDDLPIADAIFIDQGKIINVGSDIDLRHYINSNTNVIDLKGKTVLPGFIDSHTHPIATTFLYGMIDLSGFTHFTEKEIWGHLNSQIQYFKPGEWILCKGLDVVLVKDLTPPKITYLDSIAPNNPLIISSLSMHSFWANSLAFQQAGINKNSPDPAEPGFYGKDSNGELNGYIYEQSAFEPFKKVVIEALGNSVLKKRCVSVLDDYAANGNTSITSMGITTDDPNVIRLYKHLSAEKTPFINKILQKFRLLPRRKPAIRNFIFIRSDAKNLLPKSVNNGDDSFKILGVKFWYDGSPYTGSMYLNEPYSPSALNREKLSLSPAHNGSALLDLETLSRQIHKYDKAGWQVAIHTQGDRAVEEVLTAFKNAKISKHSRHRLEHCLLPSDKSINAMADLGLSPSFHINHLWYYGESLENDIIGKNRTKNILPIKKARDASLKYSLHADQPMFTSKPLDLIHTSVNRKTRFGKPIGIENKISVLDAIKSVTINAAWQIKMENKIGSLTAGKFADLVVLDKNPLSEPIENLNKIQVLQTIVNGNIIFQSN